MIISSSCKQPNAIFLHLRYLQIISHFIYLMYISNIDLCFASVLGQFAKGIRQIIQAESYQHRSTHAQYFTHHCPRIVNIYPHFIYILID
jgi:hypothetical protein